MKKSKIIVPALAIITLSTAASITGTVAWFTASRTATVTVGDMAVVKTDGTLAKTVAIGVGTSLSGGSDINAISGAKITDVSFNPATKQLWTKANADATAYRAIGDTDDYLTLTDASHPYKIDSSNYYAFTWKITLSYTWGPDHTPLNVFFDAAQSSMTKSKQEGEGAAADNATAKGFRIAMIANRTIVYAGLESAAELKGVTGAAAWDEYGDTGLTNANYSYFASDKYSIGTATASSASLLPLEKAIDGDGSQAGRADYLGQITYSKATDSIDIYCVAWYEGTDPYVVNEIDGVAVEMQKVASTLAFYSAVNG